MGGRGWGDRVSTCLAYLLAEIFLLSRPPPPPPVLAKYLVLVAFPVLSRLLLYRQFFGCVSAVTNGVWLYLVLSVLIIVYIPHCKALNQELTPQAGALPAYN